MESSYAEGVKPEQRRSWDRKRALSLQDYSWVMTGHRARELNIVLRQILCPSFSWSRLVYVLGSVPSKLTIAPSCLDLQCHCVMKITSPYAGRSIIRILVERRFHLLNLCGAPGQGWPLLPNLKLASYVGTSL